LRHHLRGEELVRERRGIRLAGRAFAASDLHADGIRAGEDRGTASEREK
jgi:hypothetical protein